MIKELTTINMIKNHIISSYDNHEIRLEDISSLEYFAKQYDDINSFLSEIALLTDRKTNRVQDDQALTLTTIHQAKGLEWDTVFIMGMNEGFFPSYRSIEEEDIEEERRLFYVASTRAKNELIITLSSINLKARRGNIYLKPSRFLQEIEEDLYSFSNNVDNDIDDDY